MPGSSGHGSFFVGFFPGEMGGAFRVMLFLILYIGDNTLDLISPDAEDCVMILPAEVSLVGKLFVNHVRGDAFDLVGETRDCQRCRYLDKKMDMIFNAANG
jgi:hypothetical protein